MLLERRDGLRPERLVLERRWTESGVEHKEEDVKRDTLRLRDQGRVDLRELFVVVL